MPSISTYMNEAYREDKFGADFVSRIDQRVQDMNATQLRGLYDHLFYTARRAQTDMWKQANLDRISHIEKLMLEKEAIVEKERKKQEDEWALERARERAKQMRAEQNANALVMVERQARIRAEEEVREGERRRLAEERSELLVKTIKAEERKDRVWFRTAVCYVILLGGTIAAVVLVLPESLQSLQSVIIGGAVGLYSIVALVIAYRYWAAAIISPLVVTEEMLEKQTEELRQKFHDEGLEDIAQKKAQFKLAMQQEKLERRERRRLAQEKKEAEERMNAQRLMEQAAALEEMSRSGLSIQDLLSGNGSGGAGISASPSRAGSIALDRSSIGGGDDDHVSLQIADADDAASIGAERPLLSASISLRFIGVELSNVVLSNVASSPRGAMRWATRISIDQGDAWAWEAPCVKNDGLNMTFKALLNSGKTSSTLGLKSGQRVRVEVYRRDEDGDAAPNKTGDPSTNEFLGVFEAIQEDFAAVRPPPTEIRTGQNEDEQEKERLQEHEHEHEGEEHKEGVVQPVLASHHAASLRGILLDRSYSRVADIAVNFLVAIALPSETPPPSDEAPNDTKLQILARPDMADEKS